MYFIIFNLFCYYNIPLTISSNFNISNCLFFYCRNNYHGGSIYGTMLKLKIEYSTFYDSFSSKWGGLFHISNSNSIIELNFNCFSKFDNDHSLAGKLTYCTMSKFIMKYCNIHSSIQNGGYEVRCILVPTNLFENLNFTYNNNNIGLGLLCPNENSNFNITDSTFTNNYVLYILNDYSLTNINY